MYNFVATARHLSPSEIQLENNFVCEELTIGDCSNLEQAAQLFNCDNSEQSEEIVSQRIENSMMDDSDLSNENSGIDDILKILFE